MALTDPVRLTRLDVLVIGALSVSAFALGGTLASSLASGWWGQPKLAAEIEREHGVPATRDAVARIERRQVKVRDAIASERVALLSSPGEADARRQRAIAALQVEARRLVPLQANTRVDAARAEAAAQRALERAKSARRREEALARAAIAAVAFVVLAVFIVAMERGLRAPVTIRPVLTGSVVALVVLLTGAALGVFAALALSIAGVAVLARSGSEVYGPH